MADLKDLIGSKKVKEFVRKEKSRPWTILSMGGASDADAKSPFSEVLMSAPSEPIPETEVKPRPIRGQTEAKPGTELRPNRGQIEAIPHSMVVLTDDNRGQTEAKPGTELRPHSRPIRGQTEAKPGTELRPNSSVSSIDGLQREILLLIFEYCKRAREKQTPPIAVEHISESCRTTYHAARKAIQRLEQKGMLKRAAFKVGRSGWTKYEVPEVAYQELLQNETEAKLRPIRGRTEDKPGTELRPEPRPSLSSSSSYKDLDLKTTTTAANEEVSKELAGKWEQIDCSPLNELRFGRPQIAQIAHAGRITVDELQDSIFAFAFDLSENQKGRSISGSPLNYFMGILRKGPYAAPANFESPEIRQRRLYLEAKEQQQKKLLEIESRLQAVEFEGWTAKLSLEEKAQLVPLTDFAKPGSPGYTVQLKEYFRENVWPQFYEKIIRGEYEVRSQTEPTSNV